MTVGPARFTAPEALFTPATVSSDSPGLSEATYAAIQAWRMVSPSVLCATRSLLKSAWLAAQGMDMDNRRALYEHVSLSGGSTMFPGLQARLQRDLRSMYAAQTVRMGGLACVQACQGLTGSKQVLCRGQRRPKRSSSGWTATHSARNWHTRGQQFWEASWQTVQNSGPQPLHGRRIHTGLPRLAR